MFVCLRVQMDQVLPADPLCLVFLDLAWPGSAPCRVLIRLNRICTHSQQFILLCTGQRGVCYANTKLIKAENNPWWQGVKGGDYQYNNGEGGAALLPDIDSNKFYSSRFPGDVSWYSGNHSHSAQFYIITEVMRACKGYTFGKVVSGLEVVAAAHKHRPITEVTVVDCGVVLRT